MESKKSDYLCAECWGEFTEYDSRHRKYCSRKCYYKSGDLKAWGRSLWLNWGKKALAGYRFLRSEARSFAMDLGEKIDDWRKVTQRKMEEYLEECKRIAKADGVNVDSYRVNLPDIPDWAKDPIKYCSCSMKMILWQNHWWCECCGLKNPV